MIGAIRQERLCQPSNPATANSHNETETEDGVIVCFDGMFGPAYHVILYGDNSSKVTALDEDEDEDEDGVSEPRNVFIDGEMDYEPSSLLAHVTLDGVQRTIQVLGEETSMTGELKLQMCGADTTVLIQSLREYELSKYMHEPEELDTSDLVLSPMPGTLIRFAVKPGDEVQLGQELCIVEAMKMQNIIKAPRAGIIATCNVDVGASMMADETILTFEPIVVDDDNVEEKMNNNAPG